MEKDTDEVLVKNFYKNVKYNFQNYEEYEIYSNLLENNNFYKNTLENLLCFTNDNISNRYVFNTIYHSVFLNINFLTQTASKTRHQSGDGGLLVHTYEVTKNAYSLGKTSSELGKKVDIDVLITSSIFHDLGKIREYERKDKDGIITFEYTHYKDYIGHIAYSMSSWNDSAEDNCLQGEFIEKVSHCILSHHGRLEWGSPVEPKTIEASILHFADMISAKF